MDKLDSDRNGWIIACVLALVLHVAGILVLYSLPLAAGGQSEIRKPVTVHLVLPPETRESNDPQMFTEQPPDRADQAPKKPDFLSNVNSRARDRVPGGADDLPQMKGVGDAPAVKLEPNGSPSSAPGPKSQQNSVPQKPAPKDGLKKQQKTETADGPISMRNPIEPEVFKDPNHGALHQVVGSGGMGSDIYQPEMDRPDGNANLIGDVSLSTIAWEYAPWLQDFERKVMRGWFAPPAYSYGILKEGGWGLFQMRVSRSGKMLSLDLLGQQGHPSLIRCAQSALSNASPLEPLPSNFPDSTLVIRVRMTYPKIPSRQ